MRETRRLRTTSHPRILAPDGKQVVVGVRDQEHFLWDIEAGEEQLLDSRGGVLVSKRIRH